MQQGCLVGTGKTLMTAPYQRGQLTDVAGWLDMGVFQLFGRKARFFWCALKKVDLNLLLSAAVVHREADFRNIGHLPKLQVPDTF